MIPCLTYADRDLFTIGAGHTMRPCRPFWFVFRENMMALGLEAPSSLFGSESKAVETLGAILAALKRLGPQATVAEVIGATTGMEKLLVVGSLGAAFYTGAAIGSLMVATAETAWCSPSNPSGSEPTKTPPPKIPPSPVASRHSVRIFAVHRGLDVPDEVYYLMANEASISRNLPVRA